MRKREKSVKLNRKSFNLSKARTSKSKKEIYRDLKQENCKQLLHTKHK